MPEKWCDWMSGRIDRPDGPVYLLCQYPVDHDGRHSWEGRRPKGHAIAAELIEIEGALPDMVDVELPEE